MSVVDNLTKKRFEENVLIIKNYCIKPSQIRYFKVIPKKRTITFVVMNNDKIKISFDKEHKNCFIDALYSLTSHYDTVEFNQFVNVIDLGRLGRYW